MEEIRAKTAELSTKEDQEEIIVSNKILATEHALIKRIGELAADSDMNEAVRAFQAISQRKNAPNLRFNFPAQPGGAVNIQNNTVINLSVPKHAVPEYILNEQSEVIAINNQPMAPLSSDGVRDMFQQMNAAKQKAKQALASPPESKKSSMPAMTLQDSREALEDF